MDRRLPGGYGQRKGSDAYLGNSESQYLREALIPKEGGWVISPLGDAIFGHYDVTGILPGANTTKLFLLPNRASAVACTKARIHVATADAGSTVQTALYRFSSNEFCRVPGSHATFSSATTGLKTVVLSATVDVLPDTVLFLGIKCTSATAAIQGFQSGASTTPRVLRNRSIAHGGDLQTKYLLSATSTDTSDSPMVAYLSNMGDFVL